MREIDFLPEWYKQGKRHQRHMRRQYAALTVIFLAMVGYNLVSTHRISRATAELARFEDERGRAESTFHEFNTVTKELNEIRVKADVIERIDSKIDMGAVLAEMSHIIGETVVLSRVEFLSESPADADKGQGTAVAGVRPADAPGGPLKKTLVGDVRFRIVLTGLAVSPADVAALVCRLDDSVYFDRVHASFWRSSTIHIPARRTQDSPKPPTEAAASQPTETTEATEFEVVCYLANCKESESR